MVCAFNAVVARNVVLREALESADARISDLENEHGERCDTTCRRIGEVLRRGKHGRSRHDAQAPATQANLQDKPEGG